MLYSSLLIIHSLLRWIIIFLFLVSLVRWFVMRKHSETFNTIDKLLVNSFIMFLIFQLIIGIELYLNSPLVQFFLSHFNEGIHQRQPRFFGMEHSSMMLTGIALIFFGIVKSKQKETPYKTLFIYYGIAFLIIFFSIPWEFSPLTSRPLWRWF